MTSGSTACRVYYNQTGNSNYTAAAQVASKTTAIKATQTITVTTPAPSTAAYNSRFKVAARASSGLQVAITASGGCSGSGFAIETITMTSSTTACVVTYNKAGNDNYRAAAQVSNTTIASLISQSITVTEAARPGAARFSSFAVAAKATSGLPVRRQMC